MSAASWHGGSVLTALADSRSRSRRRRWGLTRTRTTWSKHISGSGWASPILLEVLRRSAASGRAELGRIRLPRPMNETAAAGFHRPLASSGAGLLIELDRDCVVLPLYWALSSVIPLPRVVTGMPLAPRAHSHGPGKTRRQIPNLIVLATLLIAWTSSVSSGFSAPPGYRPLAGSLLQLLLKF